MEPVPMLESDAEVRSLSTTSLIVAGYQSLASSSRNPVCSQSIRDGLIGAPFAPLTRYAAGDVFALSLGFSAPPVPPRCRPRDAGRHDREAERNSRLKGQHKD